MEAPKTKQDLDQEKAIAKMAEKEAKQKAAAEKKEKAEKERAEKALAREAERQEKAVAKAERDAKRHEELMESNPNRTYTGSMLSLAEKVKAGVYVKGVNGQLRSNDEVAVALESCSPGSIVNLLTKFLGEAGVVEGNPYVDLNIGQQSMNLRNKLRGAIKAEKVKLEDLITLRDEGGFADIEHLQAEKKKAKEAKLAAAAAKTAEKAKAEAAKPVPAPVLSAAAADVANTPAAKTAKKKAG